MSEEQQSLTKKERRALRRAEKAAAKQAVEQKNKRMKLVGYGIFIVLLVLVGWWMFSRQAPVATGEAEKPTDQVTASDYVKGNPEADVVLIEYSDFQCPACAAYAPLIAELLDTYGDRVAFVYRHFPLKQTHFQATLAAQAAEAAGKQGKFYEMHDILFDKQQEWAGQRKAEDMFLRYAEDIGLNVSQFQTDLHSKEIRGLVEGDYQSGLAQRVNATPSFYLNGEKIDNPSSGEAFASLISAAVSATASAEPTE